MAQALIRNLDDDLLADYREAARRNRRSLESELREALNRARPINDRRRQQLADVARRLRAMTPEHVVQTPSEQLVREDREGQRGP